MLESFEMVGGGIVSLFPRSTGISTMCEKRKSTFHALSFAFTTKGDDRAGDDKRRKSGDVERYFVARVELYFVLPLIFVASLLEIIMTIFEEFRRYYVQN